MNYKKKKKLLLKIWIKNVLSIFDYYFICYVIPLNSCFSTKIKKHVKNIKFLQNSCFKILMLNEITASSFSTGKLAIVYFNDTGLTEKNQYLKIFEQKFLVPFLCAASNRLIGTNENLIKGQLGTYYKSYNQPNADIVNILFCSVLDYHTRTFINFSKK